MTNQLASGAALVLVLAALTSVAHAEIVTRCGASAGFTFNLESMLVPKDKTGWHKDGITSGAMQLVRDGNRFDVVYSDAQGTRSSRSDGFETFRVPGTEPSRYLIIGVNPVSGVVEHWLFDLDTTGRGTVIWGTIRGGTILPKSSLMKADCIRLG